MFERLLSPIAIGPVRLRNRVIATAHYTGFSGGPVPGEADAAYLEARSRGGTALFVTEGMVVHPTGRASGSSWVATDPAVVPALERLGDRAHRYGAALFGQLRHQGRMMSSRASRLPLWAPSALRGSYHREMPHAMTAEEIGEVLRGFALAARHVDAAGLDGVELNAAHGFLLHAFLSPFTNRRDDDYGGSPEHRLRLLREACAVVREAVAPRLAVGVRLSMEDFTPGGLGADDIAAIARALAQAGLVDYVSLSQSNYETWSMGAMVPDMHLGPAPFTHLATRVRQACGLPVAVAGGIRRLEVAEEVLARGEADLVAMTRALIADPDLVARASEPDRIRPCIACNVCWDSLARGAPVRCAVNPTVGREGEWSTAESGGDPRRVVVVGGGVAGLESARVAAARGHQVTLIERAPVLGGQVLAAARAPGRAELGAIVPWLESEARRLGVAVRLATEARAEEVAALRPDWMVLATGARDGPSPFPTARPLRHAAAVLAGGMPAPPRVAVVDDEHGSEALGVAEFLAQRGSQVTLLTPQLSFGLEMPAISLHAALARLKTLGVDLRTGVQAIQYGADGLRIADVHTGQEEMLADVDEVVLAGVREPDCRLAAPLRRLLPEATMVLVGDAQAPRDVARAIWEGHQAGRAVGTTTARTIATTAR